MLCETQASENLRTPGSVCRRLGAVVFGDVLEPGRGQRFDDAAVRQLHVDFAGRASAEAHAGLDDGAGGLPVHPQERRQDIRDEANPVSPRELRHPRPRIWN